MIDIKIKPLSPSLREKKRYLVFEVLSEAKIKDFSKVKDSILETGSFFLGKLGMAEAGIILMEDKYDANKNKGIIRVNHKHVHHLKSVLTLVKKIDDNEVIVRSIGVSGILKKAEENFMKK